MLEVIEEALIDSFKLLPFLFITYFNNFLYFIFFSDII